MASPTRILIDAATGKSVTGKTYKANSYQWPTEYNALRRVTRVHKANAYTVLTAKVDALTKQLESMLDLCSSGVQVMWWVSC